MTSGTEIKVAPGSAQDAESKPLRVSDMGALGAASKFVSREWFRWLGVSALLLIPCLWHRHIVASDLGSHLYNAWLAQLIQGGQAPGLWLSGQWTNVLFDWMLSGLGALFGLFAAEKIAVAVCVLTFFWGAFALAGAFSGRAPRFLAPILALFTYGWTFHIGLFNYYLAIGLSFFCVAVFWRGANWERLAMLPVAALVAMAHPFGLIWLACACAYLAAARSLTTKYQLALLVLAGGAIWAIRYDLSQHSITEMEPDAWYRFTGLDQLILFGDRYRTVQWAVAIFAGVALVMDLIRRRGEREFWKFYSIPLQLYVVVELAVLLLPRGVQLPHRVPIALITERLTSISAVAGCCLLAAVRPRKWHLAAGLGIAALFASFLYQDTATANRIEAQAERLVKTLPPNQRVLATLAPLENSRIMIQHSIDLACIGHCFSYGNYEPGSQVFRVRAAPGNAYVLPDYDDATDTEEGTYLVRPEDLPIYEVYQCSESGLDLCLRALAAGETNNRLGVYQQ